MLGTGIFGVGCLMPPEAGALFFAFFVFKPVGTTREVPVAACLFFFLSRAMFVIPATVATYEYILASAKPCKCDIAIFAEVYKGDYRPRSIAGWPIVQ